MNRPSHPDGSSVLFDRDSSVVVDAFRSLLEHDPEAVLFIWREKGEVRRLTRGEMKQAVVALHDRLLDEGYRPGDKVALLCESRPEWPISFLGASLAGLVVIPVDIKLAPQEVERILAHAEPSLLLVSRDCAKTFAQVSSPSAKQTWVIDDPEDGLIARAPSGHIRRHPVHTGGLDDVALIAYTSGTSAAPKGVMLSLRNLWYQVTTLAPAFESRREDVVLSMLPLNHLLELSGGLLTALFMRARIVFGNTILPNELMDLMRDHGATKMVTVPLFLEHLRKGILREVERQGAFKARVFRWLVAIAGCIPHHRFRRRIFSKLHVKFGGALNMFIVGGAPLRPEIVRFFEGLGIHVLQGYGLTETSPVVSVNRRGENRPGSVGRPLPSVEVRIEREKPEDQDGEIVVRGPNVMLGYYRSEAATREVLDAKGWFRTGDVGHLDEDGYLWVTGRCKNLIVTGGGKKVLPEEVEEALALCPSIAEVCVTGLKRDEAGEQIVAVVRPVDTAARLATEALVEQLNKESVVPLSRVAGYKRPSKFIVYREEFPKTSTRKIKRKPLVERLVQEKLL